jgi:AraC-like DNA-binding protein
MPQDSEAQRFLVKYLGILSHPLTTPGLRYVVVTHINELIAVALCDAGGGAAKANRLSVPEARLKAIKVDILENLSSPELTETAVALRQRMTSRYIRMLFQAEGTTFSKFVLSHRLMRAHRTLSDPLFAGMKIIDIALAVGFSDLSYFDRAFHRQFHATPSEARAILVRGHHRVVSEERSLGRESDRPIICAAEAAKSIPFRATRLPSSPSERCSRHGILFIRVRGVHATRSFATGQEQRSNPHETLVLCTACGRNRSRLGSDLRVRDQ